METVGVTATYQPPLLGLVTEGCWTEPLMDSWERTARYARCAYCQRPTRGVYLIDGVEVEPMCARCSVAYAGTGPRSLQVVPGGRVA